jgi:hypothetical protein
LGDLGYAQAVFESNEAMQFFAMPIVVGSATSHVTIHPWVCMREHPLQLLAAEVRICEAHEFPERVFNPVWERSVAKQKQLVATPSAIRLELLRQHLQNATVRVVENATEEALLVERAGLEIMIEIPNGFPTAEPRLVIRTPTGPQEFSPVPWAKWSVANAEERVARLCSWIYEAYLMRF